MVVNKGFMIWYGSTPVCNAKIHLFKNWPHNLDWFQIVKSPQPKRNQVKTSSNSQTVAAFYIYNVHLYAEPPNLTITKQVQLLMLTLETVQNPGWGEGADDTCPHLEEAMSAIKNFFRPCWCWLIEGSVCW